MMTAKKPLTSILIISHKILNINYIIETRQVTQKMIKNPETTKHGKSVNAA